VNGWYVPTPPAAAPVPPARPRRSPLVVAGLLLSGTLLGGVAGASGMSLLSAASPTAPSPAVTPAPNSAAPVAMSASTADATVDAVAAVLPAVVTVVNQGTSARTSSSGSGVIIDRARRLIVTNSHVVEQLRSVAPSSSIEVILSDGTRLPATVVGNDPASDVAVLQAAGTLAAEAALADSSQVPLGAAVVAIGSPGVAGLTTSATDLPVLENTVTGGIVSGKGRQVPRTDVRGVVLKDLIQTDAAINPGSSGGPLVWIATRQIVGLNTLVVRSNGQDGLGFAVSSNTVRAVANQLIEKGRLAR
jgi:S1-C subfamily serine protease